MVNNSAEVGEPGCIADIVIRPLAGMLSVALPNTGRRVFAGMDSIRSNSRENDTKTKKQPQSDARMGILLDACI